MAVVTSKSSLITTLDSAGKVAAPGLNGGRVRSAIATLTTNADDSATSTFEMVRLPSNARILEGYLQCSADFTSAGTATVDLGMFADSSDSALTDDKDNILDGVDIETAAARYALFTAGTGVEALSDQDKPLWELMGGSADPNEHINLTVTLNTDLTAAGELKLVVLYATD